MAGVESVFRGDLRIDGELMCRGTQGRHPAGRIKAKKVLLPKPWGRFFWKGHAGVGLGSQRKLRGAGKLERFLRYVGVNPQIKKQKHYVLDYIEAFENVLCQNPDCSGLY